MRRPSPNPVHPTPIRHPILPRSNNALFPGQYLGINQSLRSPNGLITLILQGDGNLVLYWGQVGNPSDAVWASNTVGSGAVTAAMQGDGNFVLYTPDNRAVWASNTAGIRDANLARVTVNNDVTFTVGTPAQPNAFRTPGIPGVVSAPCGCARKMPCNGGPRGCDENSSLVTAGVAAPAVPSTLSNNSTYIVVGVSALAVGVLGAILYRNRR